MPHAHLDAPEPGPGAARGRAALALGTAMALLGSAGAQTRVHLNDVAGDGIRALCVVAHPDDEIAFSGTVYKIATHLGGAVDVVVITNSEPLNSTSTSSCQIARRSVCAVCARANTCS